MSGFKVCVYAIAKNEAGFVDRWMDSMQEADLVVVADTGSTDDTVSRLRARGAVVFEERITPWRFDEARNAALSHVPEDADICVSTDLDEFFLPGWRRALEDAWRSFPPGVARRGAYLYNWSLQPDGSPGVQFYCAKAHDRFGFRWRCPVHEYVAYEGTMPLQTIQIDGAVLNHEPDPSKSRASYLPLLELAVQEAPEDVRMRYYLGREYLLHGDWQKCVETLSAYLLLPSADWREERCAAMRWIAKACHSMNRLKDAYAWFYRAVAECPGMRDAYVEFAWMCSELRDWPMAYFLTEEALKIQEKSATYVNMGYAWDSTPDDLCAVAAHHMNLNEAALAHAKRAADLAPWNDRLKQNLVFLLNAVRLER